MTFHFLHAVMYSSVYFLFVFLSFLDTSGYSLIGLKYVLSKLLCKSKTAVIHVLSPLKLHVFDVITKSNIYIYLHLLYR